MSKCGAEPGKRNKVETTLLKAAVEDRTDLWKPGENLATKINPKRQEGKESGPG